MVCSLGSNRRSRAFSRNSFWTRCFCYPTCPLLLTGTLRTRVRSVPVSGNTVTQNKKLFHDFPLRAAEMRKDQRRAKMKWGTLTRDRREFPNWVVPLLVQESTEPPSVALAGCRGRLTHHPDVLTALVTVGSVSPGGQKEVQTVHTSTKQLAHARQQKEAGGTHRRGSG